MDKWLEEELTGGNLPHRELIATILWQIWKARNTEVLHRINSKPGAIVEDAINLCRLYNMQNSPDCKSWPEKTTTELWTPPETGQWKFNVDGSWNEGGIEGLVGGICRDHMGLIITGLQKGLRPILLWKLKVKR